MILVSACLAGINCKYNGKNNYNEKIFNLIKEGKAIPICPEQLGGLQTPRFPAEIKNSNNNVRIVVNNKGTDVTKEYVRGAEEVLKLAKELNIEKAIFQQRSPSCGKGKIYNGEFNGKIIEGNGITTEMLLNNNIPVISLEEFLEEI